MTNPTINHFLVWRVGIERSHDADSSDEVERADNRRTVLAKVSGVSISPLDGWTALPLPTVAAIAEALARLAPEQENAVEIAQRLVDKVSIQANLLSDQVIRNVRAPYAVLAPASDGYVLEPELVTTPGSVGVERYDLGEESLLRYFVRVAVGDHPRMAFPLGHGRHLEVAVEGRDGFQVMNREESSAGAVRSGNGEHVFEFAFTHARHALPDGLVVCRRTSLEDEYTVGVIASAVPASPQRWLVSTSKKEERSLWRLVEHWSDDGEAIGPLPPRERSVVNFPGAPWLVASIQVSLWLLLLALSVLAISIGVDGLPSR